MVNTFNLGYVILESRIVMKLGYEIKMTQEQRMVFNQSMQQSIKLLQMPLSDLREYIYNQYSENPVLDIGDFDFNKSEFESKEITLDFKDDYCKLAQNIYENNYYNKSRYYDNGEEEKSPLNMIASKKSLNDFLMDQMGELVISEYTKSICEYIICSLSSSGYLEISVEQISEELGICREHIEEALKIVQALEPTGIAARDMKECLIFQIEKLGIKDGIIEEIILNDLENIARNKYEFVAKKLGIKPKKVQEYSDIIKRLEPKPSRGFYTGDEVNYTIPDAEIKNIDGQYFIIMNEVDIPKLSINKTYRDILQDDGDKNTKLYVKDKINQALFLIKSIEQRKSTLYKILECLLDKQRSFFDKGKNYIKPLTLKEVADEIEMHDSTVSRAIKDKYIFTNHGTIRIKDLFVNKTSKDETQSNIASVIIKNRIKNIVKEEDKSKPMSDEKISMILKEEDIKISRRTVAKYREELGIKSSALRKRI